jgi:N-acetylglucosamine kinase-like BadF-type ATPase
MAIYLGLDCGGSACRAMAIDDTGEPVFLAQGGSANIATTPVDTLDRSLRRALDGVPHVDVVCACFAGMVNAERRSQAQEMLRPLLPGARLFVEPDYAAALRACPEGTTACVISGTGSIVCSRVEGQLVRSGGRGYLLGDEGSGFRYGRAALRRFLDDPDTASPQLTRAIYCLLETKDPDEATVRLYSCGSPASLLAGLSTALLKDAQAKETYALQALESESGLLAGIAATHLSRYHPLEGRPQLGLGGGLWKRSVFRDAFARAMKALAPDIAVVKSEMPPVRGAALLAKEAA